MKYQIAYHTPAGWRTFKAKTLTTAEDLAQRYIIDPTIDRVQLEMKTRRGQAYFYLPIKLLKGAL